MDLNYLLSNAGRFAYEYSKFFKEDEKLLKYFKTNESVLVFSTKRIAIFYVGIIIDYKQEYLTAINQYEFDSNTQSFSTVLEKKEFHIQFQTEQEFLFFKHLFEKYRI